MYFHYAEIEKWIKKVTFLRYVESAELGDLVPTILVSKTDLAYLEDIFTIKI